VIDQWKNRAWTPDNVPASEASAYDGKGVALYAQYQTRLRELNAVDFGDLLLHMVTIFKSMTTCWRNISAGSATSSWTNTRIPTWRSICGCGSGAGAQEYLLRGR
jgi:hypothetical protein